MLVCVKLFVWYIQIIIIIFLGFLTKKQKKKRKKYHFISQHAPAPGMPVMSQ